MAEATILLFFRILARNPRARKLMNEVFSDKCNTEKCKQCVKDRIVYWYYRWYFGTVSDPVEVAEHIHKCIEEDV